LEKNLIREKQLISSSLRREARRLLRLGFTQPLEHDERSTIYTSYGGMFRIISLKVYSHRALLEFMNNDCNLLNHQLTAITAITILGVFIPYITLKHRSRLKVKSFATFCSDHRPHERKVFSMTALSHIDYYGMSPSQSSRIPANQRHKTLGCTL
jgi:hypothetical protein